MKQTAKYHLVGTTPLMQHNGRLADPLDPWSRALAEVTSKRAKTDTDHLEAARLEWFGGLYTEDNRIIIPGRCMTATLINAAKKKKKGMQAKAGLLCEGNFLVVHDGPEDLDALWEDEQFRDRTLMRVKGSGVMRTRAKFFPWSATIEVSFNDETLNRKDVDSFVEIGGTIVGVLEGRPRFGMYTTQKL